jgi:hypothetical protein
VDGANAAPGFLLERGYDRAYAEKVWLGVALHTTPGVPEFLDPEIALVTAHPRPDFKNRILAAFDNGMKHARRATYGC